MTFNFKELIFGDGYRQRVPEPEEKHTPIPLDPGVRSVANFIINGVNHKYEFRALSTQELQFLNNKGVFDGRLLCGLDAGITYGFLDKVSVLAHPENITGTDCSAIISIFNTYVMGGGVPQQPPTWLEEQERLRQMQRKEKAEQQQAEMKAAENRRLNSHIAKKRLSELVEMEDPFADG